MRHSGPRSSRARRRHSTRPPDVDKVTTPEGWPDGPRLTEVLDINTFASELLAEMKPEVMRTILQRMDVKTRKAALEPRSIPAAKVSLRAASQVLALARAEDKPAESQFLGKLLSPAADLFDEARLESSHLIGLRLKLVDLGLPLLAYSESVYRGIRTWYRWCSDEFEDLTLAAVIGLDCANAALAAAYLAWTYPQIAERYESLRDEFPDMPKIAEARLTTSNPLSRYLSARPDRKMPSTAAELRKILADDNLTRYNELEQARQERVRAAEERQRRQRQRDEVLARHDPEPGTPPGESADNRPSGPAPEWQLSTPHRLPAIPGLDEWAAAVADSRALTERLLAGQAPDLERLTSIMTIRTRLDRMAKLLGDVLGEPVPANRADIDRAMTLVLSDPKHRESLGAMPRTVGDVTTRLGEPTPAVLPDPGPVGRAPDDTTSPGDSPPAAGDPVRPPESTPEPVSDNETEPDLADLDAVLRGELGARLAALAGASDHTDDQDPDRDETPADDPPDTGEPTTTSDDDTADEPAPAEDSPQASPRAEYREAVHELVALALAARHPSGKLAAGYARRLPDMDDRLGDLDAEYRALVGCTAMPMALLDLSSGAVDLLDEPLPALARFPALLRFRDRIGDLARQGVVGFDPAVNRIEEMHDRFTRCRREAQDIQDTASTRTFKYDKATKVYRHWLAPGGRLHDLLDALVTGPDLDRIAEVADQCRKAGAARAIDDTLAEVFGAGRPRIVAGARKTLIERYDELVDLAERTHRAGTELEDLRRADRAAGWRGDRLREFRDRIRAESSELDDELAQPLPHPWIGELVRRAIGLALDPGSDDEPEPEPDQARRLLPDETADSS